MRKVWVIIAAVVLLVTACKRQSVNQTSDWAGSKSRPTEVAGFSAGQIALGRRLFRANCESCHGARAQGHSEWRAPGTGRITMAAPALNDSAGAAGRSSRQMVSAIENGMRLPDGKVAMPAWKDRLSRTEIDDVVAWVRSLQSVQVRQKVAVPQAGKPPAG